MKHSHKNMDGSGISEMAIVDTFTKLIFGEEDRYSHRELRIIQAFRSVDTNVVLDSHRDMGAYLRALGVQEMIRLVARVQQWLAQPEQDQRVKADPIGPKIRKQALGEIDIHGPCPVKVRMGGVGYCAVNTGQGASAGQFHDQVAAGQSRR